MYINSTNHIRSGHGHRPPRYTFRFSAGKRTLEYKGAVYELPFPGQPGHDEITANLVADMFGRTTVFDLHNG